MGEIGWWEEAGETKVLFEADDAVLHLEVVRTGDYAENDESGGDEDPPELKATVMRPVMDGDVDGDAEVDKEDRHDEEVHGGIEAAVIFEALGCGHS